MFTTAAAAAALLALGLTPSNGPESEHLTALPSIQGVVLDAQTTRPVVNASVRLRGTTHAAVTDAGGRFGFREIQPGMYVIVVEHIAYTARSDSLFLNSSDDLQLEIQLAETAVALEPIEVTARPRKLVIVGFYDRRQRGIGTYFTRDDIEKRHVQRLSDLLSRVPGLRRTLNQDGSSRIDARGVKTIMTNCNTQYFIDGVRAEIGAIGIDVIPPRDIEAVEVYRGSSELPIQFDVGRAMCGAVLIWTRGG
ncbi:MAG: TonB-dependent receptor plug domain-containing protein [Longimicrobiales bacterium]